MAVIEPLELISVRKIGATRVRLVVRDHRAARHVIRFHFNRGSESDVYRRHLERWMRTRTSLAYVRGSDESALIDINALLARATS